MDAKAPAVPADQGVGFDDDEAMTSLVPALILCAMLPYHELLWAAELREEEW